ncbi:MAG: hypothetical protein M3Y87_09250 [Myxococcota bacterium]|nr:hypothetical protein [Myxococcota bacterium]
MKESNTRRMTTTARHGVAFLASCFVVFAAFGAVRAQRGTPSSDEARQFIQRMTPLHSRMSSPFNTGSRSIDAGASREQTVTSIGFGGADQCMLRIEWEDRVRTAQGVRSRHTVRCNLPLSEVRAVEARDCYEGSEQPCHAFYLQLESAESLSCTRQSWYPELGTSFGPEEPYYPYPLLFQFRTRPMAERLTRAWQDLTQACRSSY